MNGRESYSHALEEGTLEGGRREGEFVSAALNTVRAAATVFYIFLDSSLGPRAL